MGGLLEVDCTIVDIDDVFSDDDDSSLGNNVIPCKQVS